MLSVLLVVSVATVSLAHPYHGFYGRDDFPGVYPQLFNSQHEVSQPPTVNIFKIYAPKQIFLNGFDNKKKEQNFLDYTSKDKQMVSSPVSIIDRILSAGDMIPNEILDDDPYYFNQLDDSYEPQPSSVVSRKLPAFHEPEFNFNSESGFSRGMDVGDYSDNHIVESIRRDFNFMPNLNMHHDEACEHEHGNMMNNFHEQPPMNKFNEYPAEIPQTYSGYFDAPTFNSHFKAPSTMTLTRMSPLMTFFETIASGSQTEPEDYDREVMTTVTYGQPEILNENNEDEPTEMEIEEFIPVEALIEKIESEATTDEEKEVSQDKDVVQINRSFVKTILPDNTSVTQEVPNSSEEADNSVEEGPVDEIEVNVIKTILPDNTYTMSEVVTEEKINNDTR